MIYEFSIRILCRMSLAQDHGSNRFLEYDGLIRIFFESAIRLIFDSLHLGIFDSSNWGGRWGGEHVEASWRIRNSSCSRG